MANSPSTRPQTALFLGRGWSFPPRFEAGAVRMVEDEEDIAQSLRILFGTHAGERALQPRYGLALGEQVFEPLSTTMRSLLLERIRTAILVHEPRIQLLDLLVDDQRAVEGVLQIRLDYAERSTNTRFNLVLPYYLGDANELRASVTGN